MSSWTEMGGQVAAAEVFVLTATCVILVIDVFLTERSRWLTYVLSLLTLAGAACRPARRRSTACSSLIPWAMS